MRHVYTLADLRRWPEVAGESETPILLGVFGHPIAHSLSPAMHNAALADQALSARYARFEIAADELEEALRLVRELRFIGINLTVPHKTRALALVGRVTDEARAIGAINTIVFRADETCGDNTDGVGFREAIRADFGLELAGLDVMILGAGGAAQAIGYQCLIEKCRGLRLWNRTASKARAFRKRLLETTGRTTIVFDDLHGALKSADLIVNATTVGLHRDDVALVSREWFPSASCVFDTIYRREPTPFLREAAAAGTKTADGLSMLLYQGARAFELWFERPAPLEIMRAALLAAQREM